MIVRGPRQDRFTILNRRLIDDDHLSYRALGLLTFILDKPDDWRIDSCDLARGEGREGRDAVRTALRELEEAGYLRRKRIRRPDGTFDMESTVYDSPVDREADAGEPATGNPPSGSPATNPSTGNEYGTEKDPPYPPQTGGGSPEGELIDHPALAESFEQFWITYERTGSKKKARECWRRAVKKDRPEVILDGLRKWMAYWHSPGATRIKWPQGWLNDETWRDDPPPIVARPQRVRENPYLEMLREGVQ